MYLFFDTETADLPRRWDAPYTDTRNWPRVVQIAWIGGGSAEEASEPQVHLIKPEGFEISPGAYEQHGISTAYATQHGEPLRPVLERFVEDVGAAHALVAHNIDFDTNVVGAELVRAGIDNPLPGKQRRCTMKESADYCKLPGRYGYKWPSLTELHEILFGGPFEGAHDAAADCLACMNCFFELKKRNAI
jgi:DNA polymerase III epsilon subunit-like protein